MSTFVRSIGAYAQDRATLNGQVPMMLLGDSHGIGASSQIGLFLGLQWGAIEYGIAARWVGDLSLSEANGRVLYDGYGAQMAHSCVGGLTTQQLLAGGTGSLTSLATMLATNRPDISFVSIGTNDSGGQVNDYAAVLDVFSAYQTAHKVVWFLPPDSNSTSSTYYDPDTSRLATRNKIRQAVRESKKQLSVVLVDPAPYVGLFSRYPSTDVTADHLLANSAFYDSTHLSAEGYGFWTAGAWSQLLGVPVHEVVRMMNYSAPWQPVEWSYPGSDGNITAAAAQTYLVASSARKTFLTEFEVYNPHASTTAVVTLNKRRVPLADLGETDPATDNGTSTAYRVFKVAPGTREGWSLPIDSAPCAWMNEGWTVSCTGADVNVVAHGQKLLHGVF